MYYRATSIGPGSWHRRLLLAWAAEASSCGNRVSEHAKTCPSPYAQELKLQELFRHEETGRNTLEPSSISICIRGARRGAAFWLRYAARTAKRRCGGSGTERGFGIWHPVRGKLPRLPRRGRQRGSGNCARRSSLSGHRG